VRETDMRSLERERMYSIFAPLDAEEPLPREQLLAGRRYRNVGRWEVAGALWLPLLVLVMTLAEWRRFPAPLAAAVVASTFGALLAYALAGDRRARLK
jgi:hypothetical protein